MASRRFGVVTQGPVARLNLATFLLNVTIYSPILVLFYTGRGLSLFQVLSLEAVNSAFITLFQIPTGALADRLGLKRVVFLGHLLQGVWLLVLIASHTYWLFVVGYALLGIAISLRSGATEAWLFELLKRRGAVGEMTRAQGALWASSLVGRIASALLAIVVVRSNTDRYFVLALALSAACFFISATVVLSVENVVVSRETRERSLVALIRGGMALFRTRPQMRRIALATVVTDPAPYALLFLYQPYFVASGTPRVLFGLAAALAAAIGAFAARRVHRFEARLGMRAAFALCTIIPSLLYLLMAGVFQAELAALLFVLAFGAMQARYPLSTTLRNLHVESYHRATALSLISMLDGAWGFAGKLIVGKIADHSLSGAFLFLGVVPLLGLVATRLTPTDVSV